MGILQLQIIYGKNMIQLPESLTYIGGYAFGNAFLRAVTLSRIYIPGTVTTLAQGAFANFICTVRLFELGSKENKSKLKYIANADIQNPNDSSNGGNYIYTQNGGNTENVSI